MSSSGGSPTVVCFDLGGVVVRICRTWEEACRRAGVEIRDMSVFRMPDLAGHRRELTDAYQTGSIPCEQYWQSVSDFSGGLYSASEVQAVHESWVLGEYSGVVQLIDELNGLPGVRTACLSNTNHSHWLGMTTIGSGGEVGSPALKKIQRQFASHHLGLVKPDPAIYRRVQEELAVPPSRIVFFDDLPENITAAQASEWHAVQIDHTTETVPQIRRALAEIGVLPALA